MTPRKLLPRQEAGQVTLDNRLPAKYPQRLVLESAVRSALAGLSGSWDVVVEAPSALTLVVAVVAPNGSAWTLSCCNPGHRHPESIAETVRAACSRRPWLNPDGAASRSTRAKRTTGPVEPPPAEGAKARVPPLPTRERAELKSDTAAGAAGARRRGDLGDDHT